MSRSLRGWIVILGAASIWAQTKGPGGGATLSCSASASNVPALRFEGTTEQIGDIVITCVGGAASNNVPSADITVSPSHQITSRVFNAQGLSEALLLIDEPTTATAAAAPVPGYGSNAGLSLCANQGTAGCTAFAYPVAGSDGLPYTIVTTGGVTSPNAPNVYQGVVSGNQVTFRGVPIAAPGANGARVFRITNIRVNANGYSGGSVPVQASVSTSKPAVLPLSSASTIVGFIQASVVTSATPTTTLQQCYSQALTQVSTLSFKELFNAAFKTRVDPNVAGQDNKPGPTKGQGSVLAQNVPGAVYNSESGFTLAVTGGTAGLADFGTRLKVVFGNLPVGTRLFVSMTNVNVTQGSGGFFPSVSQAAAQLVRGETAAEGALIATPFGNAGVGPGGDPLPVVEITPPDGTNATAVWEVLAAGPNAIDTYEFGVYVIFTAGSGALSAANGATTASLSYAPASAVVAGGATPSTPRFVDTSSAKSAFAINNCRTVLLFSFVTSQSGFDTSIAISNTSTDPFGTAPQAGACTLHWYASGGANPPPTVTGLLAGPGNPAGMSTYTATVSAIAPNFVGYAIAVCGFQYAHGIAFVSDLGAHSQLAAYYALVIPDPELTGGRRANGAGNTNTGEELGH